MVSAPFATNNTVTNRGKLPESGTVIRKLSFALQDSFLCLLRRNSCAAGERSLWFQRCDFGTVKESFLLTTAAQNMRDLRRKLLSLGNHFFERLKTANFSTACRTVTSKSPLSRAFSVSDVHPRLRKRRSRCTLDCGFKTSESPALRGFVGGPRVLATAALYLVLLSNGLHRPKIRLKKFGFPPKIVPANIAKKLPPQRCSEPLFIVFFNFSHKRPTFAFTSESGHTLGPRRKIAHNGSHGETGAFPPSATARSCAVSEIPFSPPRFYIHTFPGSL